MSDLTFGDDDFWIDHSDIKIGKIIGTGAFSTVHIGRYFGDVVAVKKQTREEKDLDEYLLRELAVLKNINHHNLVAYIGAWDEARVRISTTQNVLYIVTEFCQGGDLLQLLLSSTPLSWGFRLKMAHDIISGVTHLHSHHLIHRDIKSANVLLDSNWTCKISDFGMATGMDQGETSDKKRMTYCGTEPYMAPELLFQEEYGVEADIFSYGMMLLEIMKRAKIGEDDFGIRPPSKLFHLDEDLTRRQMPTDAPGSLVVMALQCVSFESVDRPSSEEISDWILDLMEDEPCRPDDLPPLPPLPSDEFSAILPASRPRSDSAENRTSTGRPAPLLKSRTMNTVELMEATIKCGYLHKRKSAAVFSVWRQRWFVLTKHHLSWYGSRDDMVVRRGRIDVRNVKVQKTIQLRFVILSSKDDEVYVSSDATNKYAHREFAASSEEELNDWIECIQMVAGIHVDVSAPLDSTYKSVSTIDTPHACEFGALESVVSLAEELAEEEANRGAASVSTGAGVVPGSPLVAPQNSALSPGVAVLRKVPLYGKGAEDTTVSDWLGAVGLAAEYGDQFLDKGYSNLQQIRVMGIQDADLDYIGIENPMHRRMLQEAACSRFSPEFKCTISDIKEFGKATMYRLVTQYRYHRSLVYMRYSEFDQLNTLVIKLMKRTPETEILLGQMPRMPSKGIATFGTGGEALRASRRVHLENYMNELHKVVRGTDLESVVLEPLLFDRTSVISGDTETHDSVHEL